MRGCRLAPSLPSGKHDRGSGTIQHRRDIQELRMQYGHVRYSLAALLAALIGGLGILGLLSVAFRL
jgi:putative membrane protein